MFCIHCGTALDEQARFCAACGKPVNGLLTDTFSASGSSASAQNDATAVTEPSLAAAGAAETAGVSQIRPWVRYWARLIDIMFWALPGGFVLGLVAPQFALNPDPGNDYLIGMVVLLMWAFVEPLCLVVFGTTPGKSLLRIRLVYVGAGKLTYGVALSRSLKVWWRGMAAGVPLISLFTLITAYQRLKRNHRTSWDAEGGFIIQHGRVGWWRALLSVLLVFLYFFLLAVFEAM
jgi:uncharacterized RDD family membrane protein YckC